MNRFIATLAALALAGCAGTASITPTPTSADETASPSPVPTSSTTEFASPSPAEESAPADVAECDNTEIGFTVEYPADWWANEFMPGDVEGLSEEQQSEFDIPACTYFAPEEVEIVQGTAIPEAIAIWFSVRSPQEPESEGKVLSREETTVDGHEALVVEYVPPAGGFTPDGTVIYKYLVSLADDEHVTARTNAYRQPDYEDNKRVLDEMMDSITFED